MNAGLLVLPMNVKAGGTVLSPLWMRDADNVPPASCRDRFHIDSLARGAVRTPRPTRVGCFQGSMREI
jgi:hypothetical protein